MKQKHKDILARMGVTDEVLAHVKAAETQAEGEERLEEAKATCKKGFRALALKMHPDVGGDDKEFRFVKSCYESFMAAKYKGWRKQPPRKTSHRDINDVYSTYEDPIMANFREYKARMRREREQSLEDLLRAMYAEKMYSRPPRPRTRTAERRPRQPRTRVNKREQQEFYLADRKGIWRKCLGKSIPNPDIEKVRQRRAKKK